MKQGIVIITYKNSPFFNTCINSIKEFTKYDKYVVITDCDTHDNIDGFTVIIDKEDSFELGAIQKILNETDLDEFVLLQDSCEIIDKRLFDILFEEHKGKSVSIAENYLGYLGKYRRDVLNGMVIPDVRTKAESICQEGMFNGEYIKREKPIVLFPRFGYANYNGNEFVEYNGRLNLVSRNEFLKKYKGTWHTSMIKERVK